MSFGCRQAPCLNQATRAAEGASEIITRRGRPVGCSSQNRVLLTARGALSARGHGKEEREQARENMGSQSEDGAIRLCFTKSRIKKKRKVSHRGVPQKRLLQALSFLTDLRNCGTVPTVSRILHVGRRTISDASVWEPKKERANPLRDKACTFLVVARPWGRRRAVGVLPVHDPLTRVR